MTAAVIALSLTLAVTVSSVALSFRESERNWFILTGDLVVSSVATEGGWLETPLNAEHRGRAARRSPASRASRPIARCRASTFATPASRWWR